MEKQINIKHLMREILKHWKLGIIVGIIFALLLGGKAWMDGNQQDDMTYASYGELSIEKNVDNVVDVEGLTEIIDDEEFEKEVLQRIDETISDVLETRDNSAKHMSLLTSDAVLSSVEEDAEVKKEDVSVADIRDMIYLTAADNGNILEINVVDDAEEIAQLICTKLMQYGSEYFLNDDYTVESMQDATKLGSVTLELRESTSDPRNKFAIITPAAATTSFSMSGLIKNAVLGFVGGIIICCVVICAWFIVRNRIAYDEQIEEEIGMKLLGKSSQSNIYGNIYSALFLGKSTLNPVAFASIQPVKAYDGFVEGFVQMLSSAGKKVLLVEYVKGQNGGNELAVEPRNGYSYAGINDAVLIHNNGATAAIDAVRNDYDLVLIKCGDIKENPMARLAGSYADETVFLLEADTVKVRDMISAKASFAEAGEKIAGVVWMG